jgi:hypothetical protein
MKFFFTTFIIKKNFLFVGNTFVFAPIKKKKQKFFNFFFSFFFYFFFLIPLLYLIYYYEYNNKNAIINANNPVASAKAKPKIA